MIQTYYYWAIAKTNRKFNDLVWCEDGTLVAADIVGKWFLYSNLFLWIDGVSSLHSVLQHYVNTDQYKIQSRVQNNVAAGRPAGMYYTCGRSSPFLLNECDVCCTDSGGCLVLGAAATPAWQWRSRPGWGWSPSTGSKGRSSKKIYF